MKNIVNIINFVRGIEPRPRDTDLQKPVIEQIRLMRELNLKGTFLLQYDALIDKSFLDLMDTCKDFCEIGLWLEVVQPLVEKIGEKWHGRYPWDWYNDVGFLIGYEPETRLRLIDEAMAQFKKTYGKYPDSVGSWHIDAISMKYLADKYNISACCICRDQVGTDGYTMQGGYYNQAYYPSVNNMFCPANKKENQIDLPVFRMLGSDPIYVYDYQSIDYNITKCPTLEPASLPGSSLDRFDKFFEDTFDGSGISFQYTQTGQENSFGWPRMGEGIEYQFKRIEQLEKEGMFEVMTLCESGKWYRDNFKTTPPATLKALSDWKYDRYKSVWYYTNRYRVNLFWDNGTVCFRDMYIFDDRYEEHYLKKRCTTTACEFRNLPVMDGAIYSKDTNNRAGIFFTDGQKNITWDNITYTEKDGNVTVVLSNKDGHAVITLKESTINIKSNIENLTLQSVYCKDKVYGKNVISFGNKNNKITNLSFITDARVNDNTLSFTFDGFDYGVSVTEGVLTQDFDIKSQNGNITVQL